MKFYKIILLAVLVLFFMFSCGTINDFLTKVQASGQDVDTDNGNSGTLSDKIILKYLESPSPGNCFEGKLSGDTKEKVLKKINYIRSLHLLEPVSYNVDDDTCVQKGALIIAANKTLDHFPPKNWKCWSEEGRKGCATSNIFGGSGTWSPDQAIISWVMDMNVPGLGHRRWILCPFLKTIAYGHVAVGGFTGSLLKVVNEKWQETSVDFVAYPCYEYPAGLFSMDCYLSFSVIQDKKSLWENGTADFTSAKIAITSESNKKLKATDIQTDNESFGVANIIYWKVNDLKHNTRYYVHMDNVKLKNENKDYEYWFILK